MSAVYHVAQVNIARMRGALTDPVMAGLAERIDEMNALAERSRGFVWRWRGPLTSLEVLREVFIPFEPDRLFYNLSVWKTVEDLRAYIFKTDHAQMLRSQRNWTERLTPHHLALWWIPEGHVPSVAESAERLQCLQLRGATPDAFTFAHVRPRPPG